MENERIDKRRFLLRVVFILLGTFLAGAAARLSGLHEFQQILASAIFFMIILSTLLFWDFRLAVAFIGITVLLGTKVMTLPQMIKSAELDIILFLVGMMVLVGVLKDIGLFTWIIQLVIGMKSMDGSRFTIVLIFLSAFMACVVDEVTSIVFILALIFQVCDTLKVRAIPFVIIAVISTNIGSSGTMLGNPVGILIGTKAGFSFQDFLQWASPIMLISLCVTLGFLLLWYRKEIREMSAKLKERRQMQLGLGPLVCVPYLKGIVILSTAVFLIAMHHQIEIWLGIEKNTMLIMTPLAISGALMIWKHPRARHYIEAEVEWWTLLFFLFLFAIVGTLEHTGVTAHVAQKFSSSFGSDPYVLTPVILFISAFGSAFVDNIVFVAAFIPIVKEFHSPALWWALLLGACFGGNITAIGSTANIVALGMLEKKYRIRVAFWEWFKIGIVVGILTCVVAWISILLLMPYMPNVLH